MFHVKLLLIKSCEQQSWAKKAGLNIEAFAYTRASKRTQIEYERTEIKVTGLRERPCMDEGMDAVC